VFLVLQLVLRDRTCAALHPDAPFGATGRLTPGRSPI
jgi:hypothetical protein